MVKPNWKCPDQWSEWSEWLSAGLHARNRWRLPVLLVGILFANGRRTVTSWLRAAGISDDFDDYYYFLSVIGRKTKSIATQLVTLVLRTLSLPERLLLVIDDSPTKRYGPKVEGADIHHNPTPGPADQTYLYGHIWVTISLALRHPQWGACGVALAGHALCPQEDDGQNPSLAAVAIRHETGIGRKTGGVDRSHPEKRGKGSLDRHRWWLYQTAFSGSCTETLGGCRRWPLAKGCGPSRLAAQVETGEASGPRATTQVWQEQDQPGQTSGTETRLADGRVHPVRRNGYEDLQTFLATYRPVGGVVRVVLVKEDHGWFAFFCTQPEAGVVTILEALPTVPRSSRTSTTSRKSGDRANNRFETSGRTSPSTT